VLVSKWGNTVDEQARQLTGQDASPGYVRRALEASLGRLRTDHLDLYLLHLSGLPAAEAEELLQVLQDLLGEGKTRGYGWSTDDPDLAAAWVGRPGFRGLEFEVNVVHDAPELVELCESQGLAALARGPLGTGLITGTHPAGSRIVDELDFRYRSPGWLTYFTDGRPDPVLGARVEALVDVLTAGGRTVAQGALAWHWARSPVLVPIPGARTVAQARENAAALVAGPLTPQQMQEVREILETVEAGR
jgi:aryl-alcohol dehydrogenase-like predicted oxidoreductase